MNTHAEAAQAGELLAEVFGDGMTASMVGPKFTCGEANSIAEALVHLGYVEEAITFLTGHSEGDDDFDDSHRWWYDDNSLDDPIAGQTWEAVAQLARQYVTEQEW